jgi:hypothetical protein
MISPNGFNDDFALLVDFQYKPLRQDRPPDPHLLEGREDEKGLQTGYVVVKAFIRVEFVQRRPLQVACR